jgi:hypothetical protein
MIRFAAGLAIIVFTAILGIYKYLDIASDANSRQAALYDALDKRDQGKNLQQRIREIRRISALNDDAKKLDIERLLNIGAPGMEWRFVGQPLTRGSNKALYRYTFRIAGPSTYNDSQDLLERMNQLPGFVTYRYCFACTEAPRGTAPGLSMVQIEGYYYAYDPATFY